MRTALPPPNLAGFDLNLLVAFEALWVERSVTRAGRRLGLSQPAASGALSRLRETLGDTLFVRGRGGLEPTERCAQLAGPVTKALAEMRHALSGASFSPRTADREFTVGGVDAALAVVGSKLAARVVQEAPGVRLRLLGIDPHRAVDLLEGGAIDLALSPVARPSSTVRAKALFEVALTWAVRPGHPVLKKKTGLETYPRLRVGFEGSPATPANVTVSSFLAVPHILAECDATVVLPLPFARRLEQQRQVVRVPGPAGQRLPVLTMRLLWPEAQHAAPASEWLRGLITDVAKAMNTPRR